MDPFGAIVATLTLAQGHVPIRMEHLKAVVRLIFAHDTLDNDMTTCSNTSIGTWFRCVTKMVPKISGLSEVDEDIDYVPKGLQHTWYSMDFYTYWTATGQCWIICSETPEDFPQRLMGDLEADGDSLDLMDPLVMHRFLFDRIVHLLDISVRRIRDQARQSSTNMVNV